MITLNGKQHITVKTLHGKFDFPLQRFKNEGEQCSFFDLTNQCQDSYLSSGLQEYSAYYSNRLSYQEVEKLIVRTTGQKSLSDQWIWQGVIAKATEVSQQNAEQAKAILKESGTQPVIINPRIDLYDSKAPEILLFDDGILAKRQKENRHSKNQEERPKPLDSERKWVTNDVLMVETAKGGFEYLTTPMKEDGKPLLSLELTLQAKLIDEYGGGTFKKPLNIVAIIDGARSIRCRLELLFGPLVCMILDWYHLGVKVRKLMGMIAADKENKRLHLKEIMPKLWCGQVSKVIDYLQNHVQARSPDALQKLLTYLENHKSEIIDYRRRQQAGKTIGSGRVEKGVDLVVGYRQKKKGMSWSNRGSRALAILKVVELNGQWEQLWFPETEAESCSPG